MNEYNTELQIDMETSSQFWEIRIEYRHFPASRGHFYEPPNGAYIEVDSIKYLKKGKWIEMPEAVEDFLWPDREYRDTKIIEEHENHF